MYVTRKPFNLAVYLNSFDIDSDKWLPREIRSIPELKERNVVRVSPLPK